MRTWYECGNPSDHDGSRYRLTWPLTPRQLLSISTLQELLFPVRESLAKLAPSCRLCSNSRNACKHLIRSTTKHELQNLRASLRGSMDTLGGRIQDRQSLRTCGKCGNAGLIQRSYNRN